MRPSQKTILIISHAQQLSISLSRQSTRDFDIAIMVKKIAKPNVRSARNSKSARSHRSVPELQVEEQIKELKFIEFRKLPKELRDMIWGFALPGSKIVKIACNPLPGVDLTNFEQITASYPIPALLHTNKEARDVAFKAYDQAFSENLGGKPVFFDWTRDGLAFGSATAAKEFYGLELDSSPALAHPRVKSASKSLKQKLLMLALANMATFDKANMSNTISAGDLRGAESRLGDKVC